MKIKKLIFVICLLVSFTLLTMNNEECGEVAICPPTSDCAQFIALYSDLPSALNLAQTCKNYQTAFHEAIISGYLSSYTEALQLPLFDSLQHNYNPCTHLLISYACSYRDITTQLKQTPLTQSNLTPLTILKQERRRYKNLFNSIWKYSLIDANTQQQVRGVSIVQIMKGYSQYVMQKPSLKIEIYSGIFLKDDLIEQAFDIFLQRKEFSLINQLVRTNIKLFDGRRGDDANGNSKHQCKLQDLYKKENSSRLLMDLIDYGIRNHGDEWLSTSYGTQEMLYLAYLRKDSEMINFLGTKGIPCRMYSFYRFEIQLNHEEDVLAALLSAGFYSDEQKRDLLILAIEKDKKEKIELLRKYTDIEKIPLPVLCKHGQVNVVKEMVTENADLIPSLIRDKTCGDVLCNTVDSGNIELLQFMCSQEGIDVNMDRLCNNEVINKNALCRAIKKGYFEAARILLKHHADINKRTVIKHIFEQLNYPEDTEKIQFMLKNGLDVYRAIEATKDLRYPNLYKKEYEILRNFLIDYSYEKSSNRLYNWVLLNKSTLYHTGIGGSMVGFLMWLFYKIYYER